MCRRPAALEGLAPAEREAFTLDAALSAVARSFGAFDLALGATLAVLFDRGLLSRLSYARESDYARERLGMSPSAVSSCVRLARELRHRPILRQAVTAGAVSPRKALAVLPLAVGDYEGAWTEAAMRLSVREIESAAKAAGSATPEERFEAEAIVLPMTPGQQDRLDAALALAKEDLGPEARRWQCMEVICQEYLSSFAEFDGGGGDLGSSDDPRSGPGEPLQERAARPPPMTPHAAKVVARQLGAIDEALEVIRGIEKEHPGEDALALDARALRLVAARRRYDESLGILARRMLDGRYHELLRYGFDAYCEERLGMRAGAVRTRIWLERRMEEMPALREALASGRIGYTKAVIVARRATAADVGERIARAQATTCQQLEREAEAEQDRECRGKGTRNLWSPCDAAQTLRDAIAAAQARSREVHGTPIDAGEALAVVADHFVEVWEAHHPDWVRKWRSEQRRRVLMRNGGLCSVPGCSRAAVHVHHIVFRSRGGARAEWNEIGICAVHHLHGIHLGYLEVSGRAGERLHWKFATGEAAPTEEWVTFGDDDVRRADPMGAAAFASADASSGRPGAASHAGADAPAAPAARTAPGGSGVTDVQLRAPAAAVPLTDVKPAGPAPGVANEESPAAAACFTDVKSGVAETLADSSGDGAGFVVELPDDRSWLLACDGERRTLPRQRRTPAETEVATTSLA